MVKRSLYSGRASSLLQITLGLHGEYGLEGVSIVEVAAIELVESYMRPCPLSDRGVNFLPTPSRPELYLFSCPLI